MACNGACTAWNSRIQLFGSSGSGEIIASPSDPESAFYLWLFEPSSATACSFNQANGHRWLLLRSGGAVGFGVSGYSVGDFSSGGDVHEIPSGSHWPRQAASVEAWASYYADAAPRAARIDVDGVCTDMQLERGTAPNGAYRAVVSGVGSGCHRYYFHFETDGGEFVTFPETGSLGIGPAGSCPDWSSERPLLGSGCANVPEPAAAASGALALLALAALRAARRSVPR
jgi:MYXO-CTERM domain-containing protein